MAIVSTFKYKQSHSMAIALTVKMFFWFLALVTTLYSGFIFANRVK